MKRFDQYFKLNHKDRIDGTYKITKDNYKELKQRFDRMLKESNDFNENIDNSIRKIDSAIEKYLGNEDQKR